MCVVIIIRMVMLLRDFEPHVIIFVTSGYTTSYFPLILTGNLLIMKKNVFVYDVTKHTFVFYVTSPTYT